jgi:2-keto-4-pentenoate hydratase/2-oxohepta-3-ene-1,7-dioic acid hydratase in catechol pathway
MRFATAAVLLLALIAVLSSYVLTRPVVEGQLDTSVYANLQLVPTDRAVTLARSTSGQVLLIKAVDAQGVTGIDMNRATGRTLQDAREAYNALGPGGVLKLRIAVPETRLTWSELGVPVDTGPAHIAAGTNYRAHAEEVGHEGEPFLFPKLAQPTPWNSPVNPAGRLDYEVELCAVPLQDHRAGEPTPLGYLLCGDYTDRWQLVKHIDLDGEMGYTGFPIAKGGPGKLPVGPLLVVPLEQDFYRDIELSLYVDKQLRQQDPAGKMIWPPLKILDEALADCDSPYHLEHETVKVAPCEQIPAGTIVLTGTPEGVLFNPATLWNPWAYLRDGETVTSFGTYLGYMSNLIETD